MRSSEQGLSLLEILVVVAVLGVILGVGFLLLPSDRLAVNQAADGLVSDVKLARFQAISRNKYVQVNVFPDSNAYEVIERDSGAVIKSVRLGSDQRSGSVRIRSVDVPANHVVFDPRGIGIGMGPQSVTFSSNRSDYTKTVDISQQGMVAVR